MPIVQHPAADVVLVERPDALRLAEIVSGDDLVSVERSAEFPGTRAHFWPGSGTLGIGARTGAIVVWDAVTGKRVWSTSL